LSQRPPRASDPAAQNSFAKVVVEPIRIQHDGKTLDYQTYLALPEDRRSNDEAAVVDQKFTRNLLNWLGYGEDDWIYNRPSRESGQQHVPDYRVSPEGMLAFVVEDKNTTERFTRRHVDQMRRYVAGTAGYALWTNGREVIGFRIPTQGEAETLVRIQVQPPAGAPDQTANIELLQELFCRDRYTELPRILERICVDEDTWERTDISSPGARERFIASTRDVLARLSLAARADIDRAFGAESMAREELKRIRAELDVDLENLLESLRRSPHRADELSKVREELQRLIADPLDLNDDAIDALRPAIAAARPNESSWGRWKQTALELAIEYRQADLQQIESRRITTAAEMWKTRYKVIETEVTSEPQRLQSYAEQVAYTFFLRLLLARILEDRGLLPRLISDGGLARWRELLQSQFDLFSGAETTELLPGALLAILYRKVARCYRHFFSQPVFDWFEPDEYLLARSLDVLSGFDFREIREDILGFTYEAYIDEVARSKKGHFLTRAELVEMILSEAGYEGREILGRRLLDPASGSGSFLVQAARRLRRAIFESEGIAEDDEEADREKRLSAARAYLTYLQRDLTGLEINPFSCYLAELNLYIQALEDVIYVLRESGMLVEIERFQIYNTNSLELPFPVLYETDPSLELRRAALDEAWDVKHDGKERFHFIVGNPPYVNRGIVTDAPSYGAIPFYRRILSGDSNTFLLFMRLAQHYGAPAAILSFVVPINVLGDSSCMAARELFDSKDWHLEGVVRFYRRHILFPGVLQRVCVFTARRTPEVPPTVRIRGGNTVGEAYTTLTEAAYKKVTQASPEELNGRWKRAWLCVPGGIHYAIWDHLRERVATDVERLARGRLVFQQGDVNKKRTKVYRTETETAHSLPITCGAQVTDFGPWQPDVYLDPTIDAESTGLSGSALRDAVRERAERILRVRDLDHEEAVFCLKDNVGMEPIRPVRGSLYTRGPSETFLFDHTLQIGYAATASDNALVRAVFGLLTSVVSSYVLQLFSTNAHVTTNELLRTPVPELTERDMNELAAAAGALQTAGEVLHRELERYSGKLWLARISLDGRGLLQSSGLPTTTLDILIRRGRLSKPEHRGWKVSRLVKSGELQAEDDPRLNQVMGSLLGRLDRPFHDVEHEDLLPAEEAVAELSDRMAKGHETCETAYEKFLEARAQLDRQAFLAYGVDREDWQRTMIRGVPWAVEGKEEAERLERILFG
jgi:type I restriction-modification system DNA methylase subunit